MHYYIAIPSYKRVEMLKEKTLALLERYNISSEIVTIFVADKEEYKIYREALPDKWRNIVVGVKGMVGIRNFMINYYNEGDRVVFMDDDLESIEVKVNDKKTKPIDDLNKFIIYAWQLCDKYNCGLWGINAVLNPFYMKNTITLDLKFIVGCFFGMRISRGILCSDACPVKIDYELTIKFYIRDGRVLRFNYIAPKTNYYHNQGGLSEFDRKTLSKQAADYLVATYPMYCEYNNSRKSGFTEIKLVDKLKKYRSLQK